MGPEMEWRAEIKKNMVLRWGHGGPEILYMYTVQVYCKGTVGSAGPEIDFAFQDRFAYF